MNSIRLVSALLLTFVVEAAAVEIQMYGIGGAVMLALIIVGIILCCCCCCKRNDDERPGTVYVQHAPQPLTNVYIVDATSPARAQPRQYSDWEWQQWNQQQLQNQQPHVYHANGQVQPARRVNQSPNPSPRQGVPIREKSKSQNQQTRT